MSKACANSFWVPAAVWLALSGCASAPSAPTETAVGQAEEVPEPTIPAQAQQQFDQALALMSAGQREQAAQQLQSLSDEYPDYAGPLLNLGILQLQAARYVEAEQSFKTALQRDAKSAHAYNYLGIVYRNLGRFQESEAAYQQALNLDDNYALAHFNLGVLCDLYLQQPERALAEFERYQELSATPEPQVANWIKELQRRAGSAKKEGTTGAAGLAQRFAEKQS